MVDRHSHIVNTLTILVCLLISTSTVVAGEARRTPCTVGKGPPTDDAKVKRGVKFSPDFSSLIIPLDKSAAKKAAALESILGNVVIPKISVEDAKLSTVLAFLEAQSKRLGTSVKGVKIELVNVAKKRVPTITMDFDNIPLSMALAFICQSTSCTLEVKGDCVLVTVP